MTATTIDPRLASAFARQLELRRATLDGGAAHVGWKLGPGEADRIGGHIAVGFLTTATVHADGATLDDADPDADLHADAEMAVALARAIEPGASAEEARAAIGAYAPALEICDLRRPPGTREEVVAANAYHRAVAFGPWAHQPADPPTARIVAGGRIRGEASGTLVVAPLLCEAAAVLASAGLRLRGGDLVITGLVVQVPVQRGENVTADLGPLGSVSLRLP